MAIGDVIRKYRKNKGMTQEEMAACLGITTPAVNKWERGNTLPDITLLAPIARLLDITTDELLSFKDELTEEEINQYLSNVQKDLENKSFHEVFISVKEKIQEYPNCEKLIWQAAVILDANRITMNLPNKENYDDTIFGWFERCLHSKNEQIHNQAADSLFHGYFRKEDYEKANQYLDYFSSENPERKRRKALVNSKTGKKMEACREYEELIFTEYQHIQMTLNGLRMLYMEDNNHEMAKKLAEVSSSAASTFEMGKYNEVCFGLEVAAWEKDVAWTAQLMQDILENIETIGDFAKSRLYQHMTLKTVGSEFSAGLKQKLLESFTDESFSYMQGNEYWEKLKRGVYDS